MKKLAALMLAVLLLTCCSLSAMAAGVDDGVLSVAEKDGIKYFGTEVTKGCTKYVAANGNGSYYYDMNGDRDMNICDLVALHNNEVDFDRSGTYNAADSEALRIILIQKGENS